MHWNFCPECGHRIYQHTERDGCRHVTETDTTVKVRVTMMAESPPNTFFTFPTETEIPARAKKVCDCEVKHKELVMT